jgi:hypothetical protein
MSSRDNKNSKAWRRMAKEYGVDNTMSTTAHLDAFDPRHRLPAKVKNEVRRHMQRHQANKSPTASNNGSTRSGKPLMTLPDNLNTRARYHILKQTYKPKAVDVFLPSSKWGTDIRDEHELFSAAIRSPSARRQLHIALRGKNAPLTINQAKNLLERYNLAPRTHVNAADTRLMTRLNNAKFQIAPTMLTLPSAKARTLETVGPSAQSKGKSLTKVLEQADRLIAYLNQKKRKRPSTPMSGTNKRQRVESMVNSTPRGSSKGGSQQPALQKTPSTRQVPGSSNKTPNISVSGSSNKVSGSAQRKNNTPNIVPVSGSSNKRGSASQKTPSIQIPVSDNSRNRGAPPQQGRPASRGNTVYGSNQGVKGLFG